MHSFLHRGFVGTGAWAWEGEHHPGSKAIAPDALSPRTPPPRAGPNKTSAEERAECALAVRPQMLTITLEESDCFAAWISVSDVPGLEPKLVDGKGELCHSTNSTSTPSEIQSKPPNSTPL